MRPTSQAGTTNVRKLTSISFLIALMALFTFTSLGFIPITPMIAITIMHIPVLVGLLSEGLVTGILLGFFFGLFSLLRSLTPTQPMSIFFMNPLVSIVPRVLVPCVAWLAYKISASIIPGKSKLPVSWTIAALVGSMANTIGVLGMLYVVYRVPLAESLHTEADALWGVLGGIVLTNGIAEAVFSTIVVPLLIAAIFRRNGNRITGIR